MECFIVLPSDVDSERRALTLRGEEAHHASRVLRLQPGDDLLATDLAGNCFRCQLKEAPGELVVCQIEEELPNYGESGRDVLLIVSPLSQPARWEFLLEKATELGATGIQPVHTDRTERQHFRRERSEKILRAAVKQTKRARIPALNDVIELREALRNAQSEGRRILLLHESAPAQDSLMCALSDREGNSMALVIGPEGGFSETEVRMALEEFGAQIASLGPCRLRAETAAIAALSIAVA